MKQVTPTVGLGGGPPGRRGFTVIEVLITIAVLGVILAVALPSYQSSLRKGRRVEAFTALSNIQQAQERLRSTRETYANSVTTAVTATPPGLGWPSATTETGYYTLVIAWEGGGTTSYVTTATAVPGTSQEADGPCAVLAVRVQGGNIRYGAGASIDWTSTNTDPQRCWAR